MPDSSLDILHSLLAHAKTLGASAADAVLFETTDIAVSRRMRLPENLERSETSALGLRVFCGAKQAMVSSTDLTQDSLHMLAERAVAMAKSATEDADSVLAPDLLLAKTLPELDLFDAVEPTESWLMQQAQEAEEAALAIKGITNSEGADASYSAHRISLVTTPESGAGFNGSYRASSFSLSASVLAGSGAHMERDYDYAHTRHRADLPNAASIGKKAAENALKRLNPKKVPTCKVPVVFDPRVSRSLLRNFAHAISGSAIVRGTSFLKNHLGKPLFSCDIRIIDNPLIPRALASRPFDGEGVAGKTLHLVENGILQSWITDTRSAKKLGLTSTGHASRGVSTPPSPSSTNIYMGAGAPTPQALIADIESGFFVTEAFGNGVNLITGDYSQGASGFWIEKGEITYAVSEVTIAGNLLDMFAHTTPANDLEFRYTINCPTLRIEGMTVAGA